MNCSRLFFVALVLCAGCQSAPSPSKPKLDSSVDATLLLMQQRLELMKEVAAAKTSLNLPVEDSAREEAILQAVEVDAKAAGVDKAFAREFFTAQFEAAKLVQAANKQSPAKGNSTDESLKEAGEKLNEIRTKINDINIKLLTSLGAIDWAGNEAEARKLFAARGPEALKTHGETVAAKALAPLMPK